MQHPYPSLPPSKGERNRTTSRRSHVTHIKGKLALSLRRQHCVSERAAQSAVDDQANPRRRQHGLGCGFAIYVAFEDRFEDIRMILVGDRMHFGLKTLVGGVAAKRRWSGEF